MRPSDLRGRLSVLRDTLRTQLWLSPAIGVALALALGVGLTQLGAETGDELPAWLTAYLFGGGASAARTVLEIIAGSLITVTSLTFSMTVVTLQLASSQFSPRLLRTFSSDRFVQLTLAVCLATFTYALTVLRTIRSRQEGEEFVPQLAVTVGFVLALASVLALVLFLAHLARKVRVETLLRQVHREAKGTIRRVLPERAPVGAGFVFEPPPSEALCLPAGASGFVLSLDEERLVAAAAEADVVLFMECCPGSMVVSGTPLGAGWSRADTVLDAGARSRLVSAVAAAVRTGPERTAAHDVTYGVRQLVDVVVKALSPGINDPTTAVHALGHLSAVLCELAGRELGLHPLCDRRGTVRVVLCRPDFADVLGEALVQPTHYGAHDPLVLTQLFRLLRDLAWCTSTSRHVAIADRLRALQAEAARQRFGPGERARLTALAEQIERALAGRFVPVILPGRT
ncbi:DUF2254 domain-containing protein [Nonomuraea sp. NPDC049504]|uniref:DUF2254 domain-containing protein n=1 Tax=Nonomuraea sp. NPDC049504 TaxID=3154729 RepID=UPI003445966B